MDYKYTAIIIEPRKHKALYFVLNNVCDCLSDEWKIILFHGSENILYSIDIVEKLNILYNNRISLVNLDIINLNFYEYSGLLMTRSIIYDYIETEIFLVFQSDSMIFKKNADLINNFLDYDYVGSPWLITNYTPTKECDYIGNGGFSLRRKNKMLEIIDKITHDNIDKRYEDLYFSKKYDNIEIKKPEYEKCKTFSVDEVFSEITFACHKPWATPYYNSLVNIYPECELLKNLQYIEE